MSWIDWIVLIAFLAYTVWDGTRSGKKSKDIEGYLLAGRSMPWWAAGLSVMATQASAITFIGTTGLAYVEDMRFVQTYLAIPFAMIFLCMTLVPFFHRLRAFTAYEVLEDRFGISTRLLTSGLFLISRGLALGTVIAAPSYVLSLLLNLPLSATILMIGILATLYTVVGGVEGVIRTDVKQMTVMMGGLIFCFFWIWTHLPTNVGFDDALYLAGSLDKLTALDLNFDLSEKYNVWSGVFAALFLMLSYFGTDQTQVQRYLTTKSLSDARKSLLMSAYAKVPMQFFILLLGVMLYIFFVFEPAPITFRTNNLGHDAQHEKLYEEAYEERMMAASQAAVSRSSSDQEWFIESDQRLNKVREAELQRQSEILQADVNDTNYIFPYFILEFLPVGIIGLVIAGIFAAAMSSIDSELNALTTVSIVDWYRRLRKKPASDLSDLKRSRYFTLMWGLLATVSALALGETRSIIELINKIGSYFYGSILGVFVLMLWIKQANGKGAFTGLLSGMLAVFTFDRLFVDKATGDYAFFLPWTEVPYTYSKAIEFLWLNPVGAITVVVVGFVVSKAFPKKKGLSE